MLRLVRRLTATVASAATIATARDGAVPYRGSVCGLQTVYPTAIRQRLHAQMKLLAIILDRRNTDAIVHLDPNLDHTIPSQ
jgi:hypothetical protein